MLKDLGRNPFQAKSISLSYRSRGSVPRVQIKRRVTMATLAGRVALATPLINKRTKSKLINKILPYSAKENKANPAALYSVLNPETSSDSPSVKSKGVRLVSARAEINHTKTKGGQRNINFWLSSFKKANIS